MMSNHGKVLTAKVVLFCIAAVTVAPYYTQPVDTTATAFDAIVAEAAGFALGVFPWLLGEPLRFVAVLPAVLIAFSYAIETPRI